MKERISYWRSNRILEALVWKEGLDGCVVCDDSAIKLSLALKPPKLRDQPLIKKVPDETKKIKTDPYLNMLVGTAKALEVLKNLKQWAATPLPPVARGVPEPAVTEKAKPVPKFDIQEVPRAMRALGMPKAATMLNRWFEGKLNYSRTNADSARELNQDGQPYPVEMIDKTSITLDWVLGFSRAKTQYEALINQAVTSEASLGQLTKIFSRYKNRSYLRSWEECPGDIQKMHREFQFQRVPVESSLPQKITQYLNRKVANFGIPDELTMILGSFNLYAAVGEAFFERSRENVRVTLRSILVYAKDGFTFVDEEGKASQYLGHWNSSAVAIVPGSEVNALANLDWVDKPVIDETSIFGGILYPVKNSDFRAWQVEHNQGGDYIIYTNYRLVQLRRPIMLVI